MLVACTACRRHVRLGDVEPGARLWCPCGAPLVVPRVRARQAEMLHCSNCGAALSGDSSRCSYCEAEIRLSDRGWGDPCPECWARLILDASYCSSCGLAIRPLSVVEREEAHLDCPRCSAELLRCRNERLSYLECGACGGLWLEERDFEDYVAQRDREAVASLVPRRPGDLPRRAPETPVRYLPCPRCAGLMTRKNFARISGVVLDWCAGHGYWFDRRELEHVHRFIEQGGLMRARERNEAELESRRRREEERLRALRASGASLPAARTREGFELVDVLSWILTRLFG